MQVNNDIIIDMICDLLQVRCGFEKTKSLRSSVKTVITPILAKSKINQEFHPIENIDEWETYQEVVMDEDTETSHERQLEIRQKMAPESQFFRKVLQMDMELITKEMELTKKIGDLFGDI